jgi:hypothetical protein
MQVPDESDAFVAQTQRIDHPVTFGRPFVTRTAIFQLSSRGQHRCFSVATLTE